MYCTPVVASTLLRPKGNCVVSKMQFHPNSIYLVGESHRARIPSLFAAEYDIEGCDPSEQQKTYRLETKRGDVIKMLQYTLCLTRKYTKYE